MVSPRFLTFQRVWKTSDSRGCISYRWLDNTSLSTAQSYTTLEEQDLFESSLKIMFVISSELFQRNDLTTCEYYFVIFTPSGLHTTGASVWWSSSWCVIYAGMTNNCCLMYVIGNTGHSHPRPSRPPPKFCCVLKHHECLCTAWSLASFWWNNSTRDCTSYFSR